MIKILQLEDLESDALFVKRALERHAIRFEMKVVDTRQAFIDALEHFGPDIILSDHTLPAFNSFEALNIVKQKELDVPFILVTGNVSEEFAVKMMKSGAYDYILKDRIQRLPAAVINAMEKREMKRLQQKYIDEIIESERLFKQAESISHFGTWRYDLIKGVSTWSDENYRILGYEPGMVNPSPQSFLRYIREEDVAAVEDLFKHFSGPGRTGSMEFAISKQDESTRYIRCQYATEQDEAGRDIALTGFNQDITETKLAEQSLYRSNANLQTIFNNTDTAFILVDPDFRILSFNRKAGNFAQEQLGKRLYEGAYAVGYFPEDRAESILSIMHKVSDGEKISYEIDYLQKDNSTRWFDIKWIPIANIMNKKLGLILSITDIGDRKKAEVEKENITTNLMLRNKDLQQFNYIVSHNLRSHLANIMGLLEVFKNSQDKPGSEDGQNMIEMLDQSCKKLDAVVTDLNSILEIRNIWKESRERVNLHTLIEEIKAILSIDSKPTISLGYDFAEADTVFCLKSYLYSIFLNLISNSIKFKKENDQLVIDISTSKSEDHVVFEFKDNGKGIDMKKRGEQVFGLYKRFHPGTEGKGMGLFMIKTQVETMGGSIMVESEVNKGTTFFIRLPL
ncbi:MAG TPA: ATP-binding protein [Panacibacter sp.]|nr:ATP-binding protein [Panacibacter sp.]HNP45446.1 ATP-binding protein [Panacibacter sp.]